MAETNDETCKDCERTYKEIGATSQCFKLPRSKCGRDVRYCSEFTFEWPKAERHADSKGVDTLRYKKEHGQWRMSSFLSQVAFLGTCLYLLLAPFKSICDYR